jgi:hypothetical protein
MYGFEGSSGLPNFVGTIALLVSFIRIVLNHFTNKHHFGFESAIWYWHFVDGAGVKHVTYRYFTEVLNLFTSALRASVVSRFHTWKLLASSSRLYNPSFLSA